MPVTPQLLFLVLQSSPGPPSRTTGQPTPVPKLDRYPGRMDLRRDLQRDLEDLSDEETELEDAVRASAFFIRKTAITDALPPHVLDHGDPESRVQWLIPIGRHTTQLEEKNDADNESEGSDTGQSGEGPSVNEEAEGSAESEPDLDASMEDMDARMEDMDEEGQAVSGVEDVTDDYEEGSSEA